MVKLEDDVAVLHLWLRLLWRHPGYGISYCFQTYIQPTILINSFENNYCNFKDDSKLKIG